MRSCLLVAALTATICVAQENLTQTLSDLITANHLLHHHNVLDSFGHVSVRHPDDPTVFFLASSAAVRLSSIDDLHQYYVTDSSPLDLSEDPDPRSERFIHGAILQRFPNMNSVVHSHATSVLPFSTSEVPFLPVYHMVAFMGTEVPIFDITQLYNATEPENMLVDSNRFGADLAAMFADNSTDIDPAYSLVLQKFHGFSTVSTSLRTAVYQAVYATENAEIEARQSQLRHAHGDTQDGAFKVLALNQEETTTGLSPDFNIGRAWPGWVAEVEALPLLYKNQM